MTTRWDTEYRAHQAEQRRLRKAREFNARVAADVAEERASLSWREAREIKPDKDE